MLAIKPKGTLHLPEDPPRRHEEGYAKIFDYKDKEYCMFAILTEDEKDRIAAIDPEYAGKPIWVRDSRLSPNPILRIRVVYDLFGDSDKQTSFESFALERLDYYMYLGLLI